jgi:hypothetical protein
VQTVRIWHLLVTVLIAAVALALARSLGGWLVLLGAATSITSVAGLRLMLVLDSRLATNQEVGRPSFLLGFALLVVFVVTVVSASLLILFLWVLLFLALAWLGTPFR